MFEDSEFKLPFGVRPGNNDQNDLWPRGLLGFSLKVSRDTWDAASWRARLPTVARRRELCNDNNGKRKSWLCKTVRVGGLRKDFQFSGWCPGNCTELLHEDLRHPKGGMLLYHHASHFVNKLPGSTGVLKRFKTKLIPRRLQ